MTLTQITEKGIKDGEILNADINASAAIAGTKISPDFGSQGITTTGVASIGNGLTLTGTNPFIDIIDSNNNDDFTVKNHNGTFTIQDKTDSVDRLTIDSSGNVKVPTDNTKLQIGASQDLSLFHNGSTGNSNISNVTGDLFIQGNNGSGTAVNQIAVKSNAAVELNYQGTKKFETISSGATVTGSLGIGTTSPSSELHVKGSGEILRLETTETTGSNYINFNDADENKAYLGLGSGADDSLSIWLVKNSSLRFATNNTERMRITEDGNIGIGTTSPDGALSVYDTTDTYLYLQNNTTGTAAGDGSRIGFTGASSVLRIQNQESSDIAFHTAGSERLRLESDGKLALGNTSPQQLLHVWPDTANTTSSYVRVTAGDRGSGTGLDLGHDSSGNCHVNAVSNAHLIFSSNNTERMRVLNGGGLTFNGDTSSDNALDDYEEGTFSPAFKATGSNNNADTTVQESRYIKIGGLVFVTMFIDMNAHGNSTGGNANIAGLPFTASGRHYPVTVGYYNNLLQNQTILTGTVQPSTNLILLRHATGAASALAGFDYSNAIGTSTEMIVSAVYSAV